MTLPRFEALKKRWAICPPIDIALAVAVQAYKPNAAVESGTASSIMGEVQSSLGSGAFSVGKTPKWALPKKAKST
jgi:hypothetical protein